jgi:hypothetical protein
VGERERGREGERERGREGERERETHTHSGFPGVVCALAIIGTGGRHLYSHTHTKLGSPGVACALAVIGAGRLRD